MLHGPEKDPHTAHTPSSSSGTRHERPPADEEVTDTKRRRLLAVNGDTRTILSKLELRSCDGAGQKRTKMIANMTVQNKVKTQDVTKIIDAAQQISDKATLHDDNQWEDLYWNVVFTYDVNLRKVLDKDKAIKARTLEVDFFKKMGVYSKVGPGEVKKEGKIASTKWVDTDKCHLGHWSRLVGREIKRDKRQDLFSPTPHLEVLKLLIAYCVKNQRADKPNRIGVIDVSRAYFYAKCKRALKIQIPDEDWEPGDEGRVGELQLSLFGTRDAAQNWAETNTKYLNLIGFIQGRGSMCNFRHIKRDIKLTVQGNRTLRWTQVGIEYEHAGLVVKETETANMKKCKTPGITGRSNALEKEKEDMSYEEQIKFRSVAARINFLATDRADLQFASKDFCRRLASPDKSDWDKEQRIARYLMHHHEQLRSSTSRISRSKCKDLPTLIGQESGHR